VELFASAAVKPEALWALVRDVRRLPEWTDADEVLTVEPPATSPPPTSPPPPPSPPSPRSPDLDVAVGTTVVTRDGPRRLSWTVTAREPRVLELGTTLEHGRLGIGVSVVREAMGARARIVLASAYQPDTTAAALRFRIAGAAGLRRRFDAWTRRALRAAAADGPPAPA